MKKSLLLITLLLLTTTLFAQYSPPDAPEWKLLKSTDMPLPDVALAMKPGKFLDGGQTIWLTGHTTATPYQAYSFRSTDGGQTWLRGTPLGNRIANIDAFDANTALMALCDGVIHKTTDGGVTWNQVHSYGGRDGWFNGLKVLNNGVAVAIGDGVESDGLTYIARTTDKGDTWTKISYSSAGAIYTLFTHGTGVDAVGDNVWAALYQNGAGDGSFPIIRSTDAGLTWDFTRITSAATIRTVTFANDKVGMAMNQSGVVYLSTDGGVTWDILSTTPTGVNLRNVFAVKGTSQFVLIGETDNTVTMNQTPVIFYTTDNGQTWDRNFVTIPDTKRTTADYFSGAIYSNDLGFAFFRNNYIYKLGSPKVTKNFNVASETQTQNLVYKPGAILDNGNVIWFCGHEVAGDRNTYSFVSTNGGQTFKTGSMVPGRTSNIVAYNGTTALMATANGKIIRTTDGGTTWNEVHSYLDSGNPGFFNGIQIIGPDVVVAYGDGPEARPYFCKSTDKGLTFSQIALGSTLDLGPSRYGYQGHGTSTASYKSHAWFTLYGGSGTITYMVKTSDYGETWEADVLSVLGNTGTNGRIRSISFPTERYGMASTMIGEIYLIENAGDLWVKVNSPDRFYPEDSLFIYNVTGIPETKIFIAGGVRISKSSPTNRYYGAFITYDLGQTWTKIASPHSGNFTGAFNQGPGLTNTNDHIQAGIYLNENFGYALTHNGVILKLGDIPISVPPDPNGIITQPKEYSLDQNYPNPFNPSTTIKFKLNKTEHVKLVVYDALGKEVRTLLDNNIMSGDYSVVFRGDGLASGVYFYTLKVGNALETKKMVLMK